MSRYKAYSEYKDSGVEWLGEIPKHWSVKKLKFIANVKPSNVDKKTKDGEITVALCNYTDVYYNDTVDKSMDFMKASASEEQIKKFTLRAGDTIITKDSEDPNDIAIPTFVPEDMVGVICGYHLSIIRPHNIAYGAYIKRIFECGYARAYFGTRSNGLTRYGLGTYALDNVSYPKPPEEEAIIIANFLHHETAKIDILIEKQQQLIKLLKEKRQAVISHAVTKGLNPKAPMRDSGVEWLGEVPKHWVNIPLKLLVTTRKGIAFKSDDFCDQGIRVIKASDIKQLSITASHVFLPQKFAKAYPKGVLTSGDIILSTVGSNPDVVNSAVGQIGMVPPELSGALLNQNTVVYEPDETKVVREYLFYILQMKGYRDHLDLQAHGTANQSSLNISEMLDFMISLPPVNEQIEVCKFLNVLEDKLKRLKQRSSASGLFLQERRTALISAAVTGKIDVRNWQPPEPFHSNKKANKEYAA